MCIRDRFYGVPRFELSIGVVDPYVKTNQRFFITMREERVMELKMGYQALLAEAQSQIETVSQELSLIHI